MNNIIATLVAVVVTLLLIVVAVEIGEQLIGSSNATQALGEIETLRSSVKQLYANKTAYDELTNAVLEATTGMPPSMIAGEVGQGIDVNPWGGAVTVEQDQVYDDPSQFDVVFEGVPTQACADLVGYTGAGLIGLVVNNTELNLPVSVSDMAQACDIAGQGSRGGNKVTWVFR